MKTVYNKHLDFLQTLEKKSTAPLISLFVPIRGIYTKPEAILGSLIKSANMLLAKEDKEQLETPIIDWSTWEKQETGTLAIYVSKDIAHIIPLPLEMEPRVVVARSFHIKPLISSSKMDIHSLVVHFSNHGCSVYKVNTAGWLHLESFIVNEDINTKVMNNLFNEVKDKISQSRNLNTKFICLTGDDGNLVGMEKKLKRFKIPLVLIRVNPRLERPIQVLDDIKSRLKIMVDSVYAQRVSGIIETKQWFDSTAGDNELLERISSNKVKSLCVSLEDLRFGVISEDTRRATIHKSQQNIADDDLLDDLVEFAMKKGINVSVVPRKYLPNGVTFIAA